MLGYIVSRIMRMIPQLFLISLLAFIIIQLPPGDYLTERLNRLRNSGSRLDQNEVERWERYYGLNERDATDGNGDLDEDGLLNANEYKKGTKPNNPDTDGDGIMDGVDKDPLVPKESGFDITDYVGYWCLLPVSLMALFVGFLVFSRQKTTQIDKEIAEAAPVVKTIVVKCPMCEEEFALEEGATEAVCPACGASGKRG